MNRKAMVAGAGGALMFGAGAIAQIDSNQPYALGGGRNYVMEDPLVFRHSFFDVFVDDWNWTMTGGPHFPPPPGPPATGTSPAESAAHVTLPGLPPGVPVEGPMFLSFFDVFTEITPGGTQTFDTEMLSMDLTGTVPGVGPFMIRESPTRPSHGRYSVTPIGGGGGVPHRLVLRHLDGTEPRRRADVDARRKFGALPHQPVARSHRAAGDGGAGAGSASALEVQNQRQSRGG